MTVRAKPRILVLGGGFGGLEAAFYLGRRLPDQVDITLISDRNYFLYKPSLIYVPFGLNPDSLKLSLDEPAEQNGIKFIQMLVRDIDPQAKTALTSSGAYHYDYAVIATGAGVLSSEVPGFSDYAQSIYTPRAMLNLRKALKRAVEQARTGHSQKVLFVLPPNNRCVNPLYEILFMLDTWLRRQHVREQIDLTWTTFEGAYIQSFGERVHDQVLAEFEKRGIHHHTHYAVERIEQGGVTYQNGQSLPFDLLISFPPHAASRIFQGLPADDRGFITAELPSRQVVGCPGLYVAGDAGDFPLKQAFLAINQADAIAEHIAAEILDTVPRIKFDPMDVYVMDELNKAAFAQVPLALTGQAESPVEVRSDALELYKVGASPLWRLGKEAVGLYLPWRFKDGGPVQAGLSWKGVEAGLNIMSRLLAH